MEDYIVFIKEQEFIQSFHTHTHNFSNKIIIYLCVEYKQRKRCEWA